MASSADSGTGPDSRPGTGTRPGPRESGSAGSRESAPRWGSRPGNGTVSADGAAGCERWADPILATSAAGADADCGGGTDTGREAATGAG